MSESTASPLGKAAPSTEYAVSVLLVDDQALIAEAVRRMLAKQPDISFHYCGNPEAAVETAERIKPTVILLDLIMPGVDGLTLVSRYRANPAIGDTPIIMLSTKEDPVTKSATFTAGANDYLVKLPDEIELVARIRLHSKAYLNQIQRDEAYRALRESQQELMVTNIELARMASTDALTGLCSRRRWFEQATTEFRRCRRYDRPLALLMTDLDLFKGINDNFGHDAGDRVLTAFADLLRSTCRDVDVVGRLGGEEFVALLPETAIAGAETAARRIVESCRSLVIPTRTGRVTLSCSVGVTEVAGADETIEALIPRADAALYEAKRAGRDCWRSSRDLDLSTSFRSCAR